MKLYALALLALEVVSLAASEPALRGHETGGDTREFEQDIVGGNTQSSPISYFVRFTDGRCGGSLITGDMVVTAAHCVDSSTVGFPTEVTIAPTTTSDGLTVTVDTGNSVIHPDWNGSLLDSPDVAILKLASAVSTIDYPVITLNSDCNAPCDGTSMTLYGFGLTSAGGSSSSTLQTLDSAFRCIDSTNNYIALFASSSQGACQGDSGAPAVNAGVQYGISSFVVNDCASGNFDGYARVSSSYTWIQSQVCALASDTTNFSCSSFARLRRSAADQFSKGFFAAQSGLSSLASTVGFAKDRIVPTVADVKPFPMGHS